MQKTMLMTFSGEKKKENDGRDNCVEELRLSKFMAGWNDRRNVRSYTGFQAVTSPACTGHGGLSSSEVPKVSQQGS